MKDRVEAALIQLDVAWLDPERNRRRMLELIGKAASGRKLDLVVFPELANTGYVKPRDKEFAARYIDAAEPVPGPTTEALAQAARQDGLHIVVGLCQLHPNIPAALYNSAVLIDAAGEIRRIQPKAHLPAEENHYFCAASNVEVVATEIGNIGMLVCYDAWFPELARVLALKGAEIVCVVFNGPKFAPHVPRRLEYAAAMRAIENRNFVLLCNRVGTQEKSVFFGHSVAAGPTGEIIAESQTEEEEIVYATLERGVLVRERGFSPVFRERRPDLYAPLVDKL
ncbi:MAG: carbon-nitrogen hydrolase family protein [Betaproteobacteria bacterium]|nr:carbon-nitrogen hydrolase family protein [Betaproteobacteria bacterium]MBI2962013.1 carbon-nitrogen hydrolase family protein [Betaproteobacteria bacterium]